MVTRLFPVGRKENYSNMLAPIKNSYRSFSPSFLELKLFAECTMTKFSLPSEEPGELTMPRNRTRQWKE
jgi:hypothetical protein